MPSRRSVTLVRAVFAGAATGSRSQSAMAALALTPSGAGRLDRWLHRPSARRAQLLGAAGELIGDKLPVTPSRTDPAGLAPRLLFGATSAGVIAARRGEPIVVPAALGLLAAAGTSFGGVRARAAAASRFGSDLPGAVAEDAAACTLAWAATRHA